MKSKQFLTGAIKSSGEDFFSGIASTKAEDRDGETIDQKGWDLNHYKKSPVLLFGHNQFAPPVGKTFNHRISNSGLEFDFQFASTPFAQELKTLVEEDFLTAFSVGFIPKEFGDTKSGESTFTKSELLEISLVSVPSNPDALVTSRAFKSLSDETKEYIMGEIIKKGVVNHGKQKFPTRREDFELDVEGEVEKAKLDDLKVMATWIDETAPSDKNSYKLIHHASSKEWPLIKEAIEENLKNLDEVPEVEREAAKEHLEAHLKDFEETVEAVEEEIEEEDVAEDEEKSAPLELADEDRKLLQRVANGLELVGSDSLLDASAKGRPLGENIDQKQIMIRALQRVAKSVQERLRDLKRK
ncbi:MAG TPA: hypothetical protein DHN29_01650 [Cytophagales bacterium]|nr:hypothetical protein [Cytophagales bacterium]|tara:strand:+ start:19702 stop:20769 length:1068 start_codon:yes stop_codon:yes gene_type:complete